MNQTQIDAVEAHLEEQIKSIAGRIKSYLHAKPESIAYIPNALHQRFLELIPEFNEERIRVTTGLEPYTVPRKKSLSRIQYASYNENSLFFNLCFAIKYNNYDYESKKFLSILPTTCRKSIGGLFNWAVNESLKTPSHIPQLQDREHKQKFKAYSTLDRMFQMLTIQEPIWFYNHLTNLKSYNIIKDSPITSFGRVRLPDGNEISFAFSSTEYLLVYEGKKGKEVYDGKISDETEFVIGTDEILLTPDGLTVAEMMAIGDSFSKVVDFNPIKNDPAFEPLKKPIPKLKPKAKPRKPK